MISIVIPTLHEERRIRETLQRLRETVPGDFEIIVSDGGSKDKTVDIARTLADKVVVHTGVQKQTIAGGRNAGAAVANGEFIIFLDADVIIPKPEELFPGVLEFFAHDPTLVGLCVALDVNPVERKFGDQFFSWLINSTHWLLNNVIRLGSAMGEFQMVRRKTFIHVGGYREDLVAGEDNELFWRFNKIGRTKLVKKWTVYHSGRRAHQVGWVPLIFSWIINVISVYVRKRSLSKEWTEIR